jgi:hypothetical protein
MQREKLYNLQIKVYFNCILFMFKNTPNSLRSVFTTAKIGRTAFCVFFENKKYTIKMNFSLYIVELFTLHLVVYFAFLTKRVYRLQYETKSAAIYYGTPIILFLQLLVCL